MTAPRPAPRRARPVARALRHVARPLLACLLLAGAYALAQVVLDSEERRRLEADIQRFEQLEEQRRRELAEIEAALGATAAQLQQRIEERNRVSAQLAERRREREAIVGQIADLEAQRRETEGRIAGLEERLGEMRTRVSELLVALYKQRGSPALFALSRSGSFHELRVRNHYVSLLSQQAELPGMGSTLAFAYGDKQQGLAMNQRPVWVVEEGWPKLADTTGRGGANTTDRRTFEFGQLEPGETANMVWRLVAVRPGNYRVRYQVSAGLAHEALAEGRSIRALVLERGLLEEALLDKALSPERLSGLVPPTGAIPIQPDH